MTIDIAQRYAAADALLPQRWGSLVYSGRVTPHWIAGTDRFWYRNLTAAGREFLVVDPEHGTRKPAFDHDRLAQALSATLDRDTVADRLPFSTIEITGNGIRFTVDDQRIECDLRTYRCRVIGAAPRPGEILSPDGRWAAFIRDHNIHIRDRETDKVRAMTTDGREAYSYGTPVDVSSWWPLLEHLGGVDDPVLAWSPDSTRILTHRVDQRDLDWMHLVQASPPDGSRPKLRSFRYAMVGDPAVATGEFFVIDVDSGEVVQAKTTPAPMPYLSLITAGHAWWNMAGDRVHLVEAERDNRTVRLKEMNPRTGEVRQILEESDPVSVQTSQAMFGVLGRVLENGEVLWWSERSGWGHLYRYDASGQVRQLTSGDWVVRGIVSVDDATRSVVIAGSGREPDLDPYLRQLYRVSLDSGAIHRITDDRLDHDAVGSPSGRFVVDVASALDAPAQSTVIDIDGEEIIDLEVADASRLFAAGYQPPERFRVTAADGVTTIYGNLFRPHDFDPSRKYPVLDDIYPGPPATSATVRFPRSGGPPTAANPAASFAALGFAVVVVDHRGTTLRSKAFQDHSRVTGDDSYLEDHVTAVRQLAETRPWLDLDRVGIYGASGGGYASTRALLRFPDFYKVAVSVVGDHDDKYYHAMWGEKYIGELATTDYSGRANAALAGQLKGKLLLIHGEMDHNVTPHLTMRLVDALMTEDKDFDLLIVPNAEHFMLVHQRYWLRRRWDYFVQHLMGETPPAYRIKEIPLSLEILAESLGG